VGVAGRELVTALDQILESGANDLEAIRRLHDDQPGTERRQLASTETPAALEQHDISVAQWPECFESARNFRLGVETLSQPVGEVWVQIDREVSHGRRV
jgi:hypothetical protein